MSLVLLRHGQSVWNLQNRFTGWTDVGLTEKGIHEAHEAGKRLFQAGFSFDIAFTSVLNRAIQTMWIVMDEMDLMSIPTVCDWRLNERHYGALQGFNKARMAEIKGEKIVFFWRRTFSGRPPELTFDDPRHPRFDPRYRNLDPYKLPASESLEDTLARIMSLWKTAIWSCVQAGQDVLVVAHGNSLRALLKYLDNIPDEDIPALQIPTGIPLLYELNQEGKIVSRGYLWER